MPNTIFEFGDFRLDCGRFELLREGRSLRLERKPLELLILLAEKSGQLATREEIAQRLWQSEVFVDTEHGINTAIRKIRYALRDDPEDARFIQTVTGKGYRFAAPVQVMPEIAPEGERAAENGNGFHGEATERATTEVVEQRPAVETDTARQRTPAGRRAFWIAARAAAGVAAMAAIALGIFRWSERRGEAAEIHSIAVIPLDNLSGDPAQDYLADGMTEELTTMLAKDSTLRVVSRTSVMQYKRARRPLKEIAGALGVDGIVEGSVSRSGNRVHLTLQLIAARTDSHLWAESYDRDTNDASLPDEAARSIAIRLNSPAAPTAQARYVNPAAHDAYLQGRYLWISGAIGESGKYFQKAIDIQPDYAMGWAWLSIYYGGSAVTGELDPRTSLKQNDDAAMRALQLDPNLADAHHAMAAALFFARWDFAAADRELLKAISLDPQNASLYHFRGKMLSALNRQGEAIENEKKAMELDPFEKPWGLVDRYMTAREYDAAIEDCQLRLKASPRNWSLLSFMSEIYRRKGMDEEAMDYAVRLADAFGDAGEVLAIQRAYKAGGYKGYIRRMLARRLQEGKSRYVSPVELASDYARLGEREPALKLLEEAFRQRAPYVLWIQTDPAYDFLHSDPRYRSLVQRMGLPPTY